MRVHISNCWWPGVGNCSGAAGRQIGRRVHKDRTVSSLPATRGGGFESLLAHHGDYLANNSGQPRIVVQNSRAPKPKAASHLYNVSPRTALYLAHGHQCRAADRSAGVRLLMYEVTWRAAGQETSPLGSRWNPKVIRWPTRSHELTWVAWARLRRECTQNLRSCWA